MTTQEAEETDTGVLWNRLCEKNPWARKLRGVRVFLLFVMYALLLIAVGLIIGGFSTDQGPLIGGGFAALGVALLLWIVTVILAAQIETMRLVSALWG